MHTTTFTAVLILLLAFAVLFFPIAGEAQRGAKVAHIGLLRVLEHYEAQSDEEALAEDEAAYESTTHATMGVPVELVPLIRELIAKRRTG